MANYLGRPPQTWVLPVTKGCDRTFTVRRKNSAGQLEDWNALVYIVVDIDKANPTRINASVDGAIAEFIIDDNVCDLVKNTTKWRIVMSINSIETPLAVGNFERHDG